MRIRMSLLLLLILFYPLLVTAEVLPPGELLRNQASSTPSGLTFGPGSSSTGAGLLLSPSVSEVFYEIAYELAHSKDVRRPEIEQAIIFLRAAMELDKNAVVIRPLLIDLASRDVERDYSGLVYKLLMEYVDEFADLEIARRGVNYLLERQGSLEQREKLLENMMGTLANNNAVLGSELATLLGILKADKPDLKAAEYYLVQAYRNNRYNKSAFEKLYEIASEQIEPALLLERLRLDLRENPVDIEAALAFAQRAEEFQLYDISSAAYEYCAGLFAYLYPSEVLSSRIYIPWSISCYNSRTNKAKCLEIAERIRKTGRFDLRLEAIAGWAAIRTKNGDLATQIFQDAEQKAVQILARDQKQKSSGLIESQAGKFQQVDAAQLAWFYCFVIPFFPDRAMDWANRAFASEQNSPVTAALMAYALTLNNENERAMPLIKKFERNQISDLALAQIQLAEGQKAQAIETLRTAIARDPGSFAAEKAKEVLKQQGQEYIPPVDPESISAVLNNIFGQTIVPKFTPPEQIISVEFNIRGNDFSYGGEFEGVAAIVNNSPEPLVISDEGLFTGDIRVDAYITGDLSRNIPEVVSDRIRTSMLVEPGRGMLIPLKLIAGELREMLLRYPQASLNIEFVLYLDPVMVADGRMANKLTYIAPARARVQRPGFELTAEYLRKQFISISEGQLNQKIKTAQLFTGLLKEQYAMSNRQPAYRLMYADWMPGLLRDALLHESGLLRNPAQAEWVVKVHTMADMVSLPLDYELISAVAENLYNTQWPVRLMAVYLLAGNPEGGFDKVLDWVAKNDSNEFVRNMATMLGETPSISKPAF